MSPKENAMAMLRETDRRASEAGIRTRKKILAFITRVKAILAILRRS